MTVTQPRPDRMIVVANQMREAQAWAREHDLPFGSVIFAEAQGSTRSSTRLRGLRGLPYVELTPMSRETAEQLDIGQHYRFGGV